jgi:hypothetical protein
MAKMRLVSVVATFDTEETKDKSGKVTALATSRQVRLDPDDKSVQAAVDKALQAEDKDK